ncbi:MAG: hypothetical protein EH225_12915 [Calditrichaeota bacterium]|nr:family 10 glycosylhydrolase [Calditrichota bacterium]RQV92376.1 MAG: hypothetical protein EH221_11705 [bacterium]RQV98720.1 MAG: hypothetical protein EH225_12915 [Calditrichota bacterium]
MLKKTLTMIFSLLLLSVLPVTAGIPPDGNIRGLWVVRHTMTHPQKIDSLLEIARECGFTDLFVQIRGRGDAFYSSRYESRAEELENTDFDPLHYILSHQNRDSIRIHAWLNVFYIWSKDTLPRDTNHIVHRNTSWLAVPTNIPDFVTNYPFSVKNTGVEGLFVSPLQPDAQKHFLQVMSDIMDKYAVDGIHLDYIRYPDRSFDINPDVVKGFQNRYVLNPREFLMNPELFARKFSLTGYEVFSHHWRRYLMDGLTDFVAEISDSLRKRKPNILLSAAVKPDIVLARWNYYQAWDEWIEKGLIDFAVPMNYTADPNIFGKRVNSYLQELPKGSYLVGISLYNQKKDQAIRKIARINALRSSGFVLFSFDQLKFMPYLQNYLKKLDD